MNLRVLIKSLRRRWVLGRWCAVAVSAFVVMGPSFVTCARSEVTEAEIRASLEAQRSAGVQLSNTQIEEIVASFRNSKREGVATNQNTESIPFRPPESEPIISIVRGSTGIPFPKPEESVWPTPIPQTVIEPVVSTPLPVPTPTPYQRPLRCTHDATKVVPLEGASTDQPEEFSYDSLFLAEELVPQDAAEVFGELVWLVPYGPESGEAAYLRMEIYQVPCLPYRERRSSRAIYQYFGVEALKRYEAQSNGRGVVHPFIRDKLAQSRPKGRR